jgi:hypothetical protein
VKSRGKASGPIGRRWPAVAERAAADIFLSATDTLRSGRECSYLCAPARLEEKNRARLKKQLFALGKPNPSGPQDFAAKVRSTRWKENARARSHNSGVDGSFTRTWKLSGPDATN